MVWLYLAAKIFLTLSISSFQNYIVLAEIITYRNTLEFGRTFYLEIPKYSKKDVPHWSPGKGRNFIDVSDLTLTNVCEEESCKGTVELLIFLAPDGNNWIENWNGVPNMCCSKELIDSGVCGAKELNTMVIPSSIKDSFKQTVHITDSIPTTLVDDSTLNIAIEKSGIYVIAFGICDPSSSNILIDGFVESINPYGYCPADSFSNIFFYGIMSGLYLFFGLGWLVVCTLHSDELIYLQHWITAALALGMIETTLLFSHYLEGNEKGVISVGLLATALLVGVTKRAASRVVILLVSMGYSVVRQSIGEDMNRVIYLGIAYTILSSIYTLAASMPSGAKYVGDSQLQSLFSLVIMFLAITDTIFYMWIMSSLNNLIITLKSRKQTVKYDLYSKFRVILLICVLLAVVWAIYGGALVTGTSSLANGWEWKWTLDASSELIYFVIFVSIAILWAPYKNNQRYVSYVELSPVFNEDGEARPGNGGDAIDAEIELEAEYGGQLEEDPFQGTGALDPTMAILKKN